MDLALQLAGCCGGRLSEASLRILQLYFDDIVGGPEDLPDLAATILPILDLPAAAADPATAQDAPAEVLRELMRRAELIRIIQQLPPRPRPNIPELLSLPPCKDEERTLADERTHADESTHADERPRLEMVRGNGLASVGEKPAARGGGGGGGGSGGGGEGGGGGEEGIKDTAARLQLLLGLQPDMFRLVAQCIVRGSMSEEEIARMLPFPGKVHAGGITVALARLHERGVPLAAESLDMAPRKSADELLRTDAVRQFRQLVELLNGEISGGIVLTHSLVAVYFAQLARLVLISSGRHPTRGNDDKSIGIGGNGTLPKRRETIATLCQAYIALREFLPIAAADPDRYFPCHVRLCTSYLRVAEEARADVAVEWVERAVGAQFTNRALLEELLEAIAQSIQKYSFRVGPAVLAQNAGDVRLCSALSVAMGLYDVDWEVLQVLHLLETRMWRYAVLTAAEISFKLDAAGPGNMARLAVDLMMSIFFSPQGYEERRWDQILLVHYRSRYSASNFQKCVRRDLLRMMRQYPRCAQFAPMVVEILHYEWKHKSTLMMDQVYLELARPRSRGMAATMRMLLCYIFSEKKVGAYHGCHPMHVLRRTHSDVPVCEVLPPPYLLKLFETALLDPADGATLLVVYVAQHLVVRGVMRFPYARAAELERLIEIPMAVLILGPTEAHRMRTIYTLLAELD
jgi:hypothetical protein